MKAREFASWCGALVVCALLAGGQVMAKDKEDGNAPKKEAVQKKAGKEGDLDKYINLDSDDMNTKVEVITQTLYEQEQRIITLTFQQEYGDRVRIKRIAFASADRTLIPGYVFTPLKLEAGRKYPGIVMVHGGFHERFDWRWFQLIDGAVSKGYVVIFPEYRGSRGYGANHYVNEYGITDTEDVLASAQYFSGLDYVDGTRLAILGQSRGGMATLLAIEKEPTRFKAAIDIVGLADFVAYMAYKPDYRRNEVAKESAYFKGKLPNENLAAYMDVSPINHVDKIQTPLLIIATKGDKIAPYDLHTGRLLDVLKSKGKVFESKIYDDAPGGHIFMDGDTPEQRDATQRCFDFLGKYKKP
ncbi:alpha/beta hydrolase family protein [Rudaea sp.]|uniref:alpha/beta hydrolase family protein n=1 Tax=Rudaea sp. TaxID=2136325 RepID=UPI002ED50056